MVLWQNYRIIILRLQVITAELGATWRVFEPEIMFP